MFVIRYVKFFPVEGCRITIRITTLFSFYLGSPLVYLHVLFIRRKKKRKADPACNGIRIIISPLSTRPICATISDKHKKGKLVGTIVRMQTKSLSRKYRSLPSLRKRWRHIWKLFRFPTHPLSRSDYKPSQLFQSGARPTDFAFTRLRNGFFSAFIIIKIKKTFIRRNSNKRRTRINISSDCKSI